MAASPSVIELQGQTLVVAFEDETLAIDSANEAVLIEPQPNASFFIDDEQLVMVVGNDDTLLLSTGEQGPAGADGMHGVGPTLILLCVAGQTLSGHVVVRLDATGRYVPADVNNPLDGVLAAGVTTGAATEGADAIVVTSGPFSEPSWGWTPNKPVYLGANGALTQTPLAGAAFIKQVGLALTPQLVAIDFREPIYF